MSILQAMFSANVSHVAALVVELNAAQLATKRRLLLALVLRVQVRR